MEVFRVRPKVSIIIPTYLRHDKLGQCLTSIAKFLDPQQCSVVVVANGASRDMLPVFDGFNNQFNSPWKHRAHLIWFDEPLGYPKAVNVGIKYALENEADYIVLLNDDTEFLAQSKNKCIEVMLKPMLQDSAVGVTGPLM